MGSAAGTRPPIMEDGRPPKVHNVFCHMWFGMGVQYLNTREKCICCFGPPEDDYELIVHHVRYFPEVRCFVHWRCHNEIHETPSRHPHLIQYDEGDSRRFYERRGRAGRRSQGGSFGLKRAMLKAGLTGSGRGAKQG